MIILSPLDHRQLITPSAFIFSKALRQRSWNFLTCVGFALSGLWSVHDGSEVGTQETDSVDL